VKKNSKEKYDFTLQNRAKEIVEKIAMIYCIGK